MRKLAVMLLAPALSLAAPAPAPSVTCEIGVIYQASDPNRVSLRVPNKACSVEGMKIALSQMLMLLSN
jgi:hypothetical protein